MCIRDRSGVDDLDGRIAYTAELFSKLTLIDYAGLSDLHLAESVDAGVVYLIPVSYTHLRAHETVLDLVCRLLLEKKKYNRIYILITLSCL